MKGETKYAPEEPKTDLRPEETATWIDSETCNLKYTQKAPLYANDGKTIAGINVNQGEMRMTLEDLKANLEAHKMTMRNKEKQLAEVQKKIEQHKSVQKALNLPDTMSPALKRLQREIEALHHIGEIQNLEEQKKPILAEIEKETQFLVMRTATIESRPKEQPKEAPKRAE